MGEVDRAEATSELAARCVRYQPEAEQYLALGDFGFFRMAVRKVRYIAGFARMGWIEESDWQETAVLAPAAQESLVSELAARAPPGVRLLGIDCRGIDIEREGRRDRERFSRVFESGAKSGDAAKRLLAALR